MLYTYVSSFVVNFINYCTLKKKGEYKEKDTKKNKKKKE